MELLERAKTWWETLGISAKEAVVVESVLDRPKKSVQVQCPDCRCLYNSTDLHDCVGRFDVLRVVSQEATKSVWKRLALKYHIPLKDTDAIRKEAQKEMNEMSPTDFAELLRSYELRLAVLQAADPTWIIEEELWNS